MFVKGLGAFMKKTVLATLAAGMAMISAPAAAVTSVDGTVNSLVNPQAPGIEAEFLEFIPFPGEQIGLDDQNAPHLFFLREKTNVNIGALSGITGLDAGTFVDSFYIFFDPINNPASSLTAEITFGREVFAIITDTASLNATDDAFGNDLVVYDSNSFRGLEGNDSASFVQGTGNLSVSFVATSPGDYIRVLTSAVPEPSTWLMLVLGFGLIGGALRAQREKLGVQAKFAI